MTRMLGLFVFGGLGFVLALALAKLSPLAGADEKKEPAPASKRVRYRLCAHSHCIRFKPDTGEAWRAFKEDEQWKWSKVKEQNGQIVSSGDYDVVISEDVWDAAQRRTYEVFRIDRDTGTTWKMDFDASKGWRGFMWYQIEEPKEQN